MEVLHTYKTLKLKLRNIYCKETINLEVLPLLLLLYFATEVQAGEAEGLTILRALN